MFDAIVIVPRPLKSRYFRELGMHGSHEGIPDQTEQWFRFELRDHKPEGWWTAGGCHLEGSARPVNDDDELSGPLQQVEVTASTAALCIAHGRLFVIVNPRDKSQPTVWIAATISDVAVETKGSQGLRKRPQEITLKGNHWEIKVIEVYRLYRQWVKKRITESGHLEEKMQRGQEGSLVKELTKAKGVQPRYEIDAAPNFPG